MGKGYADGPAAEELLSDAGESTAADVGRAVYGSTDDDASAHFLGWLGDVDPDELFASGRAWGLSVIERSRVP